MSANIKTDCLLVCFYNRREICSLWNRDWTFAYKSNVLQFSLSYKTVTIPLIRTATSAGSPFLTRKLWTSKGKSSTFCWHTLF